MHRSRASQHLAQRVGITFSTPVMQLYRTVAGGCETTPHTRSPEF
jgi:hypothetical protein